MGAFEIVNGKNFNINANKYVCTDARTRVALIIHATTFQ